MKKARSAGRGAAEEEEEEEEGSSRMIGEPTETERSGRKLGERREVWESWRAMRRRGSVKLRAPSFSSLSGLPDGTEMPGPSVTSEPDYTHNSQRQKTQERAIPLGNAALIGFLKSASFSPSCSLSASPPTVLLPICLSCRLPVARWPKMPLPCLKLPVILPSFLCFYKHLPPEVHLLCFLSLCML